MKSFVVLCLTFCLFGLVFSQAPTAGAGAASNPASMLQRAALMRSLTGGGGGAGMSQAMRLAMITGGMDSSMMEMMLCMRSPIFCMGMMA